MKFDLPVLEFLKTELPHGSLILPILGKYYRSYHNVDYVQAIRYYPLKPVVPSFKDINPILYNNHGLLAKSAKADFLIVDFQITEQKIAKTGKKIGSFKKFSVIQID